MLMPSQDLPQMAIEAEPVADAPTHSFAGPSFELIEETKIGRAHV